MFDLITCFFRDPEYDFDPPDPMRDIFRKIVRVVLLSIVAGAMIGAGFAIIVQRAALQL